MKEQSLLKKIIAANALVFVSVFAVFTGFTALKAYGDTYRIAEEEAAINLRKSAASCLYHFRKSDFIELQRFVSSFTEPNSLNEVLMLFSGDGQIITTNNFDYFNGNKERIRGLISGETHGARLKPYVIAVKKIEADSVIYGYAVYAAKIEMRRAVLEQAAVLFGFMVVTLLLIILTELVLVKRSIEPLKELILTFRNNEFRRIAVSGNDIQEMVELKESYNFWVSEIDRYQQSLKEKARWEAYSAMAAQVAHDIRSPLAALGAAAKGLSLAGDKRTLIDGALGRMQGIADDLLQRYRAPGAAPKAKMETCALAGLIEQVLAEKRIQHKDKAGVKIEFASSADGIKAAVDPKELQRIISNLVNNSVEAFAGPGAVRVALSALDGRVLIEIKDDGKGISPEILAKLGQKGETHGKAGGTGLGLYHARTSVEAWGGSLKIESEPGKGTAVNITLPAAAKPAAGLRAVLLDDDALVHMNWKMAAKAAGAELKSFKTPQEFAEAAGTLPRDIPLYIDSELGNDIKGEDIAKDLHDKGFTDITMATGHSPEKFSSLPWLKVAGKEPPWGA